MEENNVSANLEQPASATPENTTIGKKGGQKVIRSLVMAFIQIANIAFCAMMGYLLVTFLITCFNANLGSLFGYEHFDFGFMETFGVLAFVGIAIVVALIIAVAIGFVKSNAKYYNILKNAKAENMDVVLAPAQTIGTSIWMVLALVAMLFVSLYFIQNAEYSITAILLFICIAALGIALILTIIHSIINRVKYNKLTDEEKTVVKEQSKTFKKVVAKRERKSNAGKLY